MIKILHLYYDIMNCYGDNGNFRAILKVFERNSINVKVDYKSVDDKVNINSYDFIYIGTGLDSSYDIVLNDIKRFKRDLKEYIANNGFLLATGNSLNLFSDLNILNFKYKRIDFRIVGEQVYSTSLMDKKIIGFLNRDSIMYDVKEDNLFNVISGTGYAPNDNKEGIVKNNFYGTYLIGPILVRNPYFLDYLMNDFFESKGLKYHSDINDMSYKAYEEFLNNFNIKN